MSESKTGQIGADFVGMAAFAGAIIQKYLLSPSAAETLIEFVALLSSGVGAIVGISATKIKAVIRHWIVIVLCVALLLVALVCYRLFDLVMIRPHNQSNLWALMFLTMGVFLPLGALLSIGRSVFSRDRGSGDGQVTNGSPTTARLIRPTTVLNLVQKRARQHGGRLNDANRHG